MAMGATGDRQVRAAAVGADKVMQIWEAMNDGYPYFAVYYNGRNKYFQFNKNDLEAARQLLAASLQAIEDTGDNTMYYLNIYSESMANYPNSGMIASFPFRLNPYQANETAGSIGGLSEITKALTDAHNKHLELTTKLAAAEAANAPIGFKEMIAGFLETPGTADALVPILAPLVPMVMGGVSKITGIQPAVMPIMPTPGIAGPPESELGKDEQLDVQLDRLANCGDLLEILTLLANFAEKNPGMFNMYLNTLKAQ